MSTPATLPIDLPARSTRSRPKTASAGERGASRVTSLKLQAVDELVLDALRRHYDMTANGHAIRRALHEAARAHGIDVDAFEQEASAA